MISPKQNPTYVASLQMTQSRLLLRAKCPSPLCHVQKKKMRVFPNGSEVCADNHVKGDLTGASHTIYYHFVTTPISSLILCLLLGPWRRKGQCSQALMLAVRWKLPDVRHVGRLIGGGGNQRPSHRKETLLVFVTQTTKDQAPDVALCPVIVSSNIGIPV